MRIVCIFLDEFELNLIFKFKYVGKNVHFPTEITILKTFSFLHTINFNLRAFLNKIIMSIIALPCCKI